MTTIKVNPINVRNGQCAPGTQNEGWYLSSAWSDGAKLGGAYTAVHGLVRSDNAKVQANSTLMGSLALAMTLSPDTSRLKADRTKGIGLLCAIQPNPRNPNADPMVLVKITSRFGDIGFKEAVGLIQKLDLGMASKDSSIQVDTGAFGDIDPAQYGFPQ